jgi:hypothetical protein
MERSGYQKDSQGTRVYSLNLVAHFSKNGDDII